MRTIKHEDRVFKDNVFGTAPIRLYRQLTDIGIAVEFKNCWFEQGSGVLVIANHCTFENCTFEDASLRCLIRSLSSSCHNKYTKNIHIDDCMSEDFYYVKGGLKKGQCLTISTLPRTSYGDIRTQQKYEVSYIPQLDLYQVGCVSGDYMSFRKKYLDRSYDGTYEDMSMERREKVLLGSLRIAKALGKKEAKKAYV